MLFCTESLKYCACFTPAAPVHPDEPQLKGHMSPVAAGHHVEHRRCTQALDPDQHVAGGARAELGAGRCISCRDHWVLGGQGFPPSPHLSLLRFRLGWGRRAPMPLFRKAEHRPRGIKLSVEQVTFSTYPRRTLKGLHTADRPWNRLESSVNDLGVFNKIQSEI